MYIGKDQQDSAIWLYMFKAFKALLQGGGVWLFAKLVVFARAMSLYATTATQHDATDWWGSRY